MSHPLERGLLAAVLCIACSPVLAAPTTVDAGAFQATYDTSAFFGGHAALNYDRLIGFTNTGPQDFRVTAGGDVFSVDILNGALTTSSSGLYEHYEARLDVPLTLTPEGTQPLAWRIGLDTTMGGSGGASIQGKLTVTTTDGQRIQLDAANLAFIPATPPGARELGGLVPAGVGIASIAADFSFKSQFSITQDGIRTGGHAQLGILGLTVQAVAVPETSSMWMMLTGCCALGLLARRRAAGRWLAGSSPAPEA